MKLEMEWQKVKTNRNREKRERERERNQNSNVLRSIGANFETKQISTNSSIKTNIDISLYAFTNKRQQQQQQQANTEYTFSNWQQKEGVRK